MFADCLPLHLWHAAIELAPEEDPAKAGRPRACAFSHPACYHLQAVCGHEPDPSTAARLFNRPASALQRRQEPMG